MKIQSGLSEILRKAGSSNNTYEPIYPTVFANKSKLN